MIKKNGSYFLKGSSSNQLYINQIYQMGHISLLAWTFDDDINSSNLVPLIQSDKLSIIDAPVNLSFINKIKIIKNAVKEAKSLSIKFCFVDSFIACFYARLFKKPYVIESGTDAFNSSWFHGGSIKYKLFAIPYELLTKYYHATSKYIIYVSKFFLQKKYPSKAYQMGCSDTVLSDVPIDVLERRLQKVKGARVYNLGLVGSSSVEYRGHDTLIRAMSVLRNMGYNVNVRFAGSDSGKSKRMKLAQLLNVDKFVIFDGYLTQQEIFSWIDNIDILVMPTLQETLGRAVIEAMSRGCPVIGSSETALPEQIGSDCIAPARDVDSIVKIIEHMICDKNYMELCSRENYWRAKKYSSTITDNMRRQFYQEFYLRNGININE